MKLSLQNSMQCLISSTITYLFGSIGNTSDVGRDLAQAGAILFQTLGCVVTCEQVWANPVRT
jgi:hypothetical protein